MAFNLAGYLAQSAGGVGVLGAVVGGSAAAAQSYRQYRNGLITKESAFRTTGKEAAGAGVATAISAVAVGIVGGGLLIGLGTAFAAAAVSKYAWDHSVERVGRMVTQARDEIEVENISVEGR